MSLAGDADVDGSAGAAANATLTFVALFGDLTLRVPPGSRVSVGGVGLFGDRNVRVIPGDGPEIQVNAYRLFSDVKILSEPPRSP
jgi:2-methylaconitate cis-trans-isomerase PrpF